MILLALLACPPTSRVDSLLAEIPPSPPPTSVEAHGWLEGHWAAEDGQTTETWVLTDGALVGVGFVGAPDPSGGTPSFFEVLRIDANPEVGYMAWPGGAHPVRFPAHGAPDGTALFVYREHDWPQLIRYEHAGDRVDVTLAGDGGPTKRYPLVRAAIAPVDALEAADRAMDREPLKSGASPDGRYGFTIGQDDAGSYVTVRTQAADGTWLSTFERHWAADRPPVGDVATWVAEVQAAFLRGFAVPATVEGELEAVVEVTVDAKGAVSGWKLAKTSGHAAFDEAVQRAVTDVGKVPKPPADAVDRPLVIRYVYP